MRVPNIGVCIAALIGAACGTPEFPPPPQYVLMGCDGPPAIPDTAAAIRHAKQGFPRDHYSNAWTVEKADHVWVLSNAAYEYKLTIDGCTGEALGINFTAR